MQGVFCRLASTCQGTSSVKRVLGEALSKTGGSLAYVVIIIFFKKTKMEKEGYSGNNILFIDNNEN